MAPPDPQPVYTLNDLEQREFSGTPLAVVGYPVKHSVSPVMHNAALAALSREDSRFRDWAYHAFEIEPADFAKAVSLFHERNFLGLNLTVPHKLEAMEWIQGISADGQRMGAVNTLMWDELGYDGFNTDGYGIKLGLQRDLGVELKRTPVVLLGAGGAARAAAVQCLTEGSPRVWIGNRSVERLEGLMAVLRKMPGGDRVDAFALDVPPKDLPEKGVVINATSLGLRPEDGMPLDPGRLPPGWCVYDMIYNPVETALLARARECGRRGANGLSMLVHQGARSLALWTKAMVNAQVMMNAVVHHLKLPLRDA